MLEKPDISDADLVTLLSAQWRINVSDLQFLQLGADVNTAVFKADSIDGKCFFVKLRGGEPDDAAVRVPAFLHHAGVQTVIAPLETVDGLIRTHFAPFMVIVQPFVDGESGFDRRMSDSNWFELGTALRRMHEIELPVDLKRLLSAESFSGVWRDRVKSFQAQAEMEAFADPVAAQVVRLLREHRQVVERLVARASELAARLAVRRHEFVLCHGDLHAGNVLIEPAGRLHIVDWDTVSLAPRERDLMFIGAGVGGSWDSPDEAEGFFRGYGAIDIDLELLAYYRYERVVQDIAEFCGQLLVSDARGGEDRVQSLGHFASQFEPGGVLDIALGT